MAKLGLLAGSTLWASGCDVAEQVFDTIFFAFNIVDVWV